MRVTQRVRKLLSLYESDNAGTKTSLARVLMEGKLAGTGRVIIMPVKQGAETAAGNDGKSFDANYHFQLAVDAGLSALAATREILEVGADSFAGSIPLILQINHAKVEPDLKGTVQDALRLGCVGISYFAHVGMEETSSLYYQMHGLAQEARTAGLLVALRAFLDKDAQLTTENAMAAAKLASSIGAHVVCVDMPSKDFGVTQQSHPIIATISDRIRYVRHSCFKNRNLVLFAGSDPETDDEIFADLRGIRDGAAHGYVLPQTSLHRSYDPALQMLDQAFKIYQGKA